jgi:uncharacterized protein YgiM (DUF1202 family)
MRFIVLLFAVLTVSFSTSLAMAACVRAKKSSFRKEPTSRSREIYSVGKYFPFLPTGKREKGYSQVQDMDGKMGWVRTHDLNWHWNCLAVKVQKSKLRSGPGTQFSSAETAEKGEPFLDIGGEDGWIQVQNANGEKQWINLDHIWKPREAMRMSFEPEHP